MIAFQMLMTELCSTSKTRW